MFINLVRTVNEKSVRDPKGNLTTIEGIGDVPISVELNDGKIAEFCFIIGYCRYTSHVRKRANQMDQLCKILRSSVVQDPHRTMLHTKMTSRSGSEKLVQTLLQIVARWRATQREKMSDSDDPLLSEIAQDFDCCDDTGPNVSEKLAEIMNKRWAEKLEDAKLKLKLEKYDKRANCHRLLVPKVNPEIWTNLPHGTKSAYLRTANLQKTLTKAGSVLTKMTDSLLDRIAC